MVSLRTLFGSCSSSIWLTYLAIVVINISIVQCRKHELDLEDETRPLIHITTFGFLRGGKLSVKLHNFTLYDKDFNPKTNYEKYNGKIGFTVDRTLTDGMNPYPNTMGTTLCALKEDDDVINGDAVQRITFAFDFTNKLAKVACSRNLQTLLISQDPSMLDYSYKKTRRLLASSVGTKKQDGNVGGMYLTRMRRAAIGVDQGTQDGQMKGKLIRARDKL